MGATRRQGLLTSFLSRYERPYRIRTFLYTVTYPISKSLKLRHSIWPSVFLTALIRRGTAFLNVGRKPHCNVEEREKYLRADNAERSIGAFLAHSFVPQAHAAGSIYVIKTAVLITETTRDQRSNRVVFPKRLPTWPSLCGFHYGSVDRTITAKQ